MPEPMRRTPEPEVMDEPLAAEAYALSDFSEVNQGFVEALLEFVGDVKKVDAVDLGTGPGEIPIRIVRARPKWHVIGVDGSAPMLDFAREAAREAGLAVNVKFIEADAKHTGLPAHGFDLVFSNSMLHHINNTDALWAEVKRLGKPGAYIFFRDLTRPATPEAAREIIEKYGGVGAELMQRDYYNSLLAAYTVDEVKAQFERAGLPGFTVKMVTDRHWDAFGRLT